MTKEELNRLLVGIGKFSSNDVDLFRTEVRTRNFKKGDCLLEVGDVCRSMYYVVSGSICEFGLLEDREFIQGFYLEGEWCLCRASFSLTSPSLTTIKALSDLIVWELSNESIRKLIGLSPAFCQLGKILRA
ncbi:MULTISPECIES: Crp/Fnr family transcriptional regulator [Sphingobacteriaceae]|jgi:CRP-like cAMP-binding protein|uniref:Crp/Fnr family transcriptional regulator n=1 Tax=Sphingobacteriaceae TaxID=84566 RepID=UPI000DE3B685|nr:cyclic nucleotide-binding domain-containing protein [Pedobacter nanyangensis]